ncbi:hypothetical protein [Peterkaempfera sp. SMS 1(5)a]|uniref:hypothetical protein n=1 Tax=Peterkaempfera podocarpi TaxID=3232308 RepID=UPI00366CD9BA
MPSQRSSAGSAVEQVSVIDGLRALPFPEEEGRPGTDGQWSGRGFHLAVLRESRDFWEDRSTEIVEAAEQELEADLAALAVVLTGRWGVPETVDLWPYLGFDDPGPEVGTREPLSFLCGVAGSMQVWRLPNSGRWVGLAIGQADPEWPFQLLGAVGEASSLAR